MNADFHELHFRVEELNLTELLQAAHNNINLAWDIWRSRIRTLINNYVPKYEIKQKASWIDGECLQLIHLQKEKPAL